MEKAESSSGPPPGGVQYIGAVSSCSPLIPIRSCCPLLLFSLFSFPICVLVRLARRLVGRLVMPSRFVRSAASCRPSCRRLGSFRPSARPICRSACRLVRHRFALLFARFRFACRGGLALRSRPVSFSPWHPVLLLRIVLASRRLISLSPVIPFSLARGRLGSVLVPGSRVRAVPSCSSLVPHSLRSSVSVHVLGRGAGPCRYGHGAGAACSCHLIRPLIAPYSLLTHSLRGGSVGGCGLGRRFMLLAARPLPAHAPSFSSFHRVPRPHCVLSSPHPRSKKSGNGGGGEVG